VTLRILVDENIPAADHYFGPLGQVERVNGRQLCAQQLSGADVLLVRSVTRVNGELLGASDLRFVGSATSGLDHVDLPLLEERGITFAHAPGANANSVVEYVLAAIAAIDDQLERLLAGGRVGIVGYGHIGGALAGRLAALGIDYRVYDPWLDPESVPHHAPLREVLASRVVTLHPELTLRQPWPSRHLLGAAELAALDGEQLVINASRGEVVDNAALNARLASGNSPAVVLDVWEGEPAIDATLLHRVRIGSAHIAGYSLDGKILGTRMLWQALVAHLGIALPEPDPPGGGLPPLELTCSGGGADIVRKLVQQRYDILQDDALLRESVKQADPAAAFDRLRRQYRERRELSGTAVAVSVGCDKRSLDFIQGLGCRLVMEDSVG
jgi:erythronate-4-phosphate dehydrogenase